jgi:hypothetical protein
MRIKSKQPGRRAAIWIPATKKPSGRTVAGKMSLAQAFFGLALSATFFLFK